MLNKLLITLLLALAMGTASAGKMVLLEEAAEFDTLNVRVSNKGKGTLKLKRCDECDEVRLKITPNTQLRVGNQTLPLDALNRATLRSGTVFYRVESGVVTRIVAMR